jgi:hypothetical protein
MTNLEAREKRASRFAREKPSVGLSDCPIDPTSRFRA